MELDPVQFSVRLVSGMSDTIFYANSEGVIRRWNRGAIRIFGFAEAEALGCSLDIIIPERLRERHWQGYRATMRTGHSRYRDGEIVWVPAVRCCSNPPGITDPTSSDGVRQGSGPPLLQLLLRTARRHGNRGADGRIHRDHQVARASI